MRKTLAIALTTTILASVAPNLAIAGDTHAVSNRWAGAAMGAAAAVVGGALLGALISQPAVAAPPPVVYTPPPVMQAPPPVVYSAPPVVYSSPPLVVSPPPVVYAPPPVVYPARPVYAHRAWDRHADGARHSWYR
jgi:hypothetical protein